MSCAQQDNPHRILVLRVADTLDPGLQVLKHLRDNLCPLSARRDKLERRACSSGCWALGDLLRSCACPSAGPAAVWRGMGERKRGRGEEPSENAGGQEDGSNGIMQDDTDMGTVTAEEQRKQYLAAEQGVQLEVGEEWFVVDHRWLKRFKKYTQIIDQDNEPPPPEEIDQRAIVIVPTLRRGSAATDFDETQDFVHALRKQGDAVPVMRDELCSGRDFELVTQAQWALLVKWYGGGPAIPRKVQQGDRVFVDLYPLQVCTPPDRSRAARCG